MLSDPDDTRFVACAVAVRAAYLITGDTRHFPQFAIVRTVIITPNGFYEKMIGKLAA
jgi:predicted nucleic acid-binding protein